MRGVERFTRETKLTKRVNEWETRIVPMLEEQDKHEDFDIYKNRQSIKPDSFQNRLKNPPIFSILTPVPHPAPSSR